jgi:hypothetical protein
MNLEQIITKRNAIIAAAAFVGLVILLVIANAFQSGGLEITVPETPNKVDVSVSVVYEQEGITERFTVKSNSKKTVTLKVGTVRVNSTAGDLKAANIATIKPFATQKITVSFGEQQTLTKVGSDAEFCPHSVDGTLYTYNCQGDGFIYRHPSADGRKIPVLESQYFGYVRPYGNGFLGYPIETPNSFDYANLKLSFIDPKAGTKTPVTLPGALQQIKNMHDSVTIVTSNDQNKKAFALVAREANRIFLFKDLSDTNPKEITLPDDRKFAGTGKTNSFSFTNNDTLIIYAGNALDDEVHDGQEDEGIDEKGQEHNDAPQNVKSDGRIFEYDTSGKLLTTLTTPDEFEASDVVKLNDKYYAVAHLQGVDVYHLGEGQKMNRVYRLDDAVEGIVSGGNLFMSVDAGILRFEPKEDGKFDLSNVYNNPKLRVASLFNTSQGLLVTVTDTLIQRPHGQKPPLDVYKLGKP